MEPASYVILIVACLIVSAFFSSSETALMRLRSHDVEREGGTSAAAVRDLLSSTSRLLVTILLGNNVVNILGSAAAAALAIHYLGVETGVVVATAVMTVLVLVFSEILPKAVAARHPRRVAYAVGLPLYILHAVLRPVHWLFDRAIEPAVRWIAGGSESVTQTAEEVLRLARLASVASPDSTPLAIIGSAAGAADRTVEEIMVPRTEIVAFPASIPPDELLEKVLEERFTRVPIYENDIDQILGVVHLKDLIKLVRRGRNGLHGILKPVLRVPERKLVLRLLADMQRAFVHVAIVKDEFGVTQGLVTQEDILEEIVGEIRDEFDREELLAIRPTGDGAFQSLGRVSVLDFNRESGWEVPAEPGDTLSGLVFNALGRAPVRGDSVRVPGYELRVADVSGSRVTQVRVSRVDEKKPDKKNGAARRAG
jgi:CBS domain containing-hemolysin-like protein